MAKHYFRRRLTNELFAVRRFIHVIHQFYPVYLSLQEFANRLTSPLSANLVWSTEVPEARRQYLSATVRSIIELGQNLTSSNLVRIIREHTIDETEK